MAAEFAELFPDKALRMRVLVRFQEVIAQSFVDDRSRMTQSETKRRFRICESAFRDMRSVGFSHTRILDELPRALRCRLDGAPWEPRTDRNSWIVDA